MYFEYFSHYEKSQKKIEELKKSNHEFANFLLELQKNKYTNNKSIEDYMIKPIQRLPKYVLLLKDLLRYTSPDHLDYRGIEKAITDISSVNNYNDDNLTKYLNNRRIFELFQQFGDQIKNLKLIDSNREFVAEEVLCIFLYGNQIPIIIYILSNLLLISERELRTNSLRYILHVILDSYCEVTATESTSYENAFKVIGVNDSVILIGESRQIKEKMIATISEQIQKLKHKQIKRENARALMNNSNLIEKHSHFKFIN